jgi:hypothetical protein
MDAVGDDESEEEFEDPGLPINDEVIGDLYTFNDALFMLIPREEVACKMQ